MASFARTFGALMRRCSISSLKDPSILQRIEFLGADLQCLTAATHDVQSVRRFRAFQPVCMGRRSCKIAGRKDAQNLKKMKRNSKIGKEIVAAVKKGGPSPSSNMVLAAILENARALDVPKEIVERNIKKASEKGQDTFMEKVYEQKAHMCDIKLVLYLLEVLPCLHPYQDPIIGVSPKGKEILYGAVVHGFGGVGMIVEVLTDKITRSVQDVKTVLRDSGAKLADPGSVTFKFRRVRVVNIKPRDADKDQLFSIALDAGAEDVLEPANVEDDDNDDGSEESYYKIITSSEGYEDVLSKLREEGIPCEQDNGHELLPLNPIEVDDEAMELNKDLISRLLELDDVDAVYSDQQ